MGEGNADSFNRARNIQDDGAGQTLSQGFDWEMMGVEEGWGVGLTVKCSVHMVGTNCSLYVGNQMFSTYGGNQLFSTYMVGTQFFSPYGGYGAKNVKIGIITMAIKTVLHIHTTQRCVCVTQTHKL